MLLFEASWFDSGVFEIVPFRLSSLLAGVLFVISSSGDELMAPGFCLVGSIDGLTLVASFLFVILGDMSGDLFMLENKISI